MNKTNLIATLNNHIIYYVADADFNFYISVPKNVKKTTISLELKVDYATYDIRTNTNDAINKIRDYYNRVDNSNVALVVPIFNDNIISLVRDSNDINAYNKLDMILSQTFNRSYELLVNNGLEVDNIINIINNDSCKAFNSWFSNKYSSRIKSITLLELIQTNNNIVDYNKVEASGINFVVGSPAIEEKIEKEELIKADMPTVPTIEELNPGVVPTTEKAGYVSYLLLGFISVGLSLLLLYIFIK